MKLDYSYVEYVPHCLEGNMSKIKNIKKIFTCRLFNALQYKRILQVR